MRYSRYLLYEIQSYANVFGVIQTKPKKRERSVLPHTTPPSVVLRPFGAACSLSLSSGVNQRRVRELPSDIQQSQENRSSTLGGGRTGTRMRRRWNCRRAIVRIGLNGENGMLSKFQSIRFYSYAHFSLGRRRGEGREVGG